MKKIITSNISSSVGLPLLGRSIDFMQENVQEQAVSLAYSNLNTSDDSIPIALYGCVGTFSTVVFTNDTYTITKGAILYNGEIYQVPAMSATRASISETIVFRVDTNTYQSGEPTLYTDGTSINTNQNRTIKIYNGMTGTGIVDAINMKYVNRVESQNTTSMGSICNSISATNTSSLSAQIRAIKKGDITVLHGSLIFVSNSTTPPVVTLEFNDKYKYLVKVNGSFALTNITVDLVSCGSIVGSNNINMTFNVTNPTTSGHQYIISFNITYDNLNIL
jgi:hypothetical protein